MVPSKALCARKDDWPGSGKLLCNSKGPVAGKQVLEIHNNYSPVGKPAQKIDVELQVSEEVQSHGELFFVNPREAVFVNDIPAPNNCLYGEFVLSAKPLALVEKINVQHIIDTPDSLSFVSVSDIPVGGKNLAVQSMFGDEPLFADKIVECVGQPIGLMVANSHLEAKMAAEKVKVHYNCETTGPPILTVEDAVKRESFFQVPDFWSPKPLGDFQKEMLEAENKIASAEVRIGSQYFFYLETQTALAIPDEDHGMTVYSSTQNPGILQTVIAKCLATSENNVPVITRRVGGGFGRKAFRAMPASLQSADLSAQVYWAPDSSASSYVNFGAAAAEVEVDLLIGATTILQVDIIYDAGRSLNPAIDIGQIEGAFVQGIGYFTTEEVIVDQSGKVVSDGTWTYKVPTVDMVPRKINVELLSSPMNQKRVLSSKASGEPPLLLASSVHCAIREAIRSARKEQKDNSYFRIDSPATMDVIKSLCGFHNVEYFLQNLSSK